MAGTDGVENFWMNYNSALVCVEFFLLTICSWNANGNEFVTFELILISWSTHKMSLAYI